VPGTSTGDYAGSSADAATFQAGPLGGTHPWLFTDGPFFDLTRSTLNPTYRDRGRFDTWGLVQTLSNPQPPFTGPGPYTLSDFFDITTLAGSTTPHQLQPPLRVNVKSLQIKIRIWDPRAEQARQVTIVQEV
ncbi:MAG TPA: hypothetical protein VM597_35180, partial [Gemmataceae bacterium]|nr:hypothetical protein [Gemmataceae bacterium]